MTKISFVVILSFFFFSLPSFQAQADSELPSLRIPKLTHNFGKVMRGEKLNHAFEIYNDSNDLMKIKEIRASCGCTTTTEAPFDIPPGEFRTVDITVDTKGRTGRMEQKIEVLTSDLKRSHVTFSLKGNVQAGITLDPTVVEFEQAKQSRNYKHTITAVGTGEQSVSIQEVQSSIAFLKFEVSKRNKRKNTTKIQIILPKNAPVGPFKGWVYVITDEKLDSTYWVRVYGEVVSR